MFVPTEDLPRSLFETRAGSLGILVAMIVLPGIGFLAKGKFVGFALYAVGMVLVYFSFFAGLLFSYPLLVLGFIIIFGSCYIAFVRKTIEKAN